jgi:hypothetical protein
VSLQQFLFLGDPTVAASNAFDPFTKSLLPSEHISVQVDQGAAAA